jgi:hypothetical protein
MEIERIYNGEIQKKYMAKQARRSEIVIISDLGGLLLFRHYHHAGRHNESHPLSRGMLNSNPDTGDVSDLIYFTKSHAGRLKYV